MIPLSDRIPTRRFPAITILLVLANILVFLYEMSVLSSGGDQAFQQLVVTGGVVPARVAVSGLGRPRNTPPTGLLPP